MSITNKFPKPNQRIVISLGDPAGIGMEVTLKALDSVDFQSKIYPILVGCRKSLKNTHALLKKKGINALADPDDLEIVDIPLEGQLQPGISSAKTGAASFKWLTKATQLVTERKARALVTAPIAKHAWHASGHNYPGQTERLAELSGVKEASMMFTAVSPQNGWRMNTLLATTHIPLESVPKTLSPTLLTAKLNTLLNFCRQFKEYPQLAIAGLNPHSGENGQLGKEEINWIIPLINQWRKDHTNIKLIGPTSPDICWLSAAQAWQKGPDKNSPDGILALYHDQGLIPMKLLAFDLAVNTTLGLPFLRTSPDHGTGFDIAGTGCAKPDSMMAAINTAWDLTN